jgi:5-methylcytosine-specific restriction protein A
MSRSTPEWIGKTDDAKIPPRVRQRVFDREGGKCHLCGQPIIGKKWALDHVKALINGGENRESNLRPVHVSCHAIKTAADVADKKKVAAVRKKHIGAVRPKSALARKAPKQREPSRHQQLAPKQLFKPVPSGVQR